MNYRFISKKNLHFASVLREGNKKSPRTAAHNFKSKNLRDVLVSNALKLQNFKTWLPKMDVMTKESTKNRF